MLLAGVSWSGVITAGTLYSNRSGGLSYYSVNLAGNTDSGDAFGIVLGRGGASTPIFGNDRCPRAGSCTWAFSQPYTLTVSDQQSSTFAGESVTWAGENYSFEPGTHYSLEMVFSFAASPVAAQPQAGNGVVSWTFPLAPLTTSIALTIRDIDQANAVVVSETIRSYGDGGYTGSAWQATAVGSEWGAQITETFGLPEPGTGSIMSVACATLLAGLSGIRARKAEAVA